MKDVDTCERHAQMLAHQFVELVVCEVLHIHRDRVEAIQTVLQASGAHMLTHPVSAVYVKCN